MTALQQTRAPLRDLLTVRYGRALPADRRSDNGKFPVLGSAGRLSGAAEALTGKSTVVVGRKGAVGAVHLVEGGSWPLDTTYYMDVPATFEPRYLAWQLRALDLAKLDSSTAVPSLRRQDLEAQELLQPELHEQRRIVDILEDRLSRLDVSAASISTAERRLGTLMTAQLRRLLPRDAPTRLLGDLAVRSGYGTSTKCVPQGPGVAVVRIPNLVDGMIDLADEKRAVDPPISLQSLMLEAGDLLVIRTNGSKDLIGRTAVVQDGVDASFASYLIRFQFDSSLVDPRWVNLVMNDSSIRREVESLAASSAGQYNLSLAKLNGLVIPVPDPTEQSKILRQMREMESARKRLIDGLSDARRRGKQLRRALLATAFSGQLTGAASDSDRIEELAASL